MIQNLVVILLFTTAIVYIIWIVRNQFNLKNNSCAKGCGCSAIDIAKVEKELQQKKKV